MNIVMAFLLTVLVLGLVISLIVIVLMGQDLRELRKTRYAESSLLREAERQRDEALRAHVESMNACGAALEEVERLKADEIELQEQLGEMRKRAKEKDRDVLEFELRTMRFSVKLCIGLLLKNDPRDAELLGILRESGFVQFTNAAPVAVSADLPDGRSMTGSGTM